MSNRQREERGATKLSGGNNGQGILGGLLSVDLRPPQHERTTASSVHLLSSLLAGASSRAVSPPKRTSTASKNAP